jgi:hypothetical protein
MMCGTEEGKPHPVTGKPVEELVVNNRGTSYICADCLSQSAAIMAAKDTALTDDLEIRGVGEPVVHAEEHILPTQRAAKHRLAAEARARKGDAT